MEKRDEELIIEYQNGSQEALADLYHRYKRPVLNFSLRILGNRADAEDITGEVFLTLFSRRHAYRPDAKFSTWLFTVAKNACLSRLRKKKRISFMWFQKAGEKDFAEWDVPDEGDLPDEEARRKETQARVRAAVAALNDDQRQAIVLREYHRFSYQEISDIMECSLDNVKVLIFRAREQLRRQLSSSMKEDDHE